MDELEELWFELQRDRPDPTPDLMDGRFGDAPREAEYIRSFAAFQHEGRTQRWTVRWLEQGGDNGSKFYKHVLRVCDGADRRQMTPDLHRDVAPVRDRAGNSYRNAHVYALHCYRGRHVDGEEATRAPYSLPVNAYGESRDVDAMVQRFKELLKIAVTFTQGLVRDGGLPSSMIGNPAPVERASELITFMANPHPDDVDAVNRALQLRNKLPPRFEALEEARELRRKLSEVCEQVLDCRRARAELHGGQGELMRLVTANDLWVRIIDLGGLSVKDAARLLRTCKFDASIERLLRSRLPHLHVYDIRPTLRAADSSVVEAGFPHNVRDVSRGQKVRELHADKLLHLAIGFGKMVSREQLRDKAHAEAMRLWNTYVCAHSGPPPTRFDPETGDPGLDTGYVQSETLLYCLDASLSHTRAPRRRVKDNGYTKRVPVLDSEQSFHPLSPLHFWAAPPELAVELVRADTNEVVPGGLVPQQHLAATVGRSFRGRPLIALCSWARALHMYEEQPHHWPLPRKGRDWGGNYERTVLAKYKLAPNVLSSAHEGAEFRLKITATGAPLPRIMQAIESVTFVVTHYKDNMSIVSSALGAEAAARSADKRKRGGAAALVALGAQRRN